MDKPETDDDLEALLDNAFEDFKGLEENAHLTTDPTPPRPTPDQSPSGNIFEEALKEMEEKARKAESDPEDFLNQLMGEMSEDGGNYQNMVEGMMKQLISKDLLYEPMKEIHEKYPEWLEKNKGKIDPKQYSNYLKQFGYVEKILYIFDSKGEQEGFDEVVTLMREMQELGQIPVEIVKQLAPEVEFDEQGLPKISKMDGMPGFPGTDPECNIL